MKWKNQWGHIWKTTLQFLSGVFVFPIPFPELNGLGGMEVVCFLWSSVCLSVFLPLFPHAVVHWWTINTHHQSINSSSSSMSMSSCTACCSLEHRDEQLVSSRLTGNSRFGKIRVEWQADSEQKGKMATNVRRNHQTDRLAIEQKFAGNSKVRHTLTTTML